uniref:AP complex subunit sigma n=1 Tax=Chromera velia CCMP2878 TaxID=1169474 RepID=A0A0G4GHB8_9ALVE|mmetsp:Transcript_28635/g.56085  ORF Transcript_28635/g.56085 Transcript_28635/m.56085 type:complete len:145 (-) Transcript_28635:39-473(-)|eukprot:Cvel_4711.t1-p1 / transcript=Cvel_4711.t1 / gene=Cvel_4711 / organism=Chromera_velia_CCMP2878 / gene_product=AP-4 complex subunit sigma, putative / transcript_product=AP-4 complex subunit sigma, putative / location=Cvel_scaffold209:79572-83298(+) / protein_length=144 / sequence_SO=supercontig / SO=protein_coding / is_pseudo=false
MIKFILMVNKQGQTRLSQYYDYLSIPERNQLEGELIRKCLSRSENQCSFMEYRQYKVIYRRYASLYFIVGTDNEDENELSVLELIHTLVETLDKYFENVCELDIMFNLDKAHFILDEMVVNGCVMETNKATILAPLRLMEKASQ